MIRLDLVSPKPWEILAKRAVGMSVVVTMSGVFLITLAWVASSVNAEDLSLQPARAMCPQNFPIAYRPLQNFDYCCSSCVDKTGNTTANCHPNYADRTDNCMNDNFAPCPVAPCEDFNPSAYTAAMAQEPDNKVIDKLLTKLGIPVPKISAPAMLPRTNPEVYKNTGVGASDPSAKAGATAVNITDADEGKYTYDPPAVSNFSRRFMPWIKRDKRLLNKRQRKLNIAITISIKENETSIFVNGAKQAAFFLRQTLLVRHNVVMVNLDRGSLSHAGTDWGIQDVPILSWNELMQSGKHYDLVVEEGMQLNTNQLHTFQKQGTKVVTFRTGNDYFMTVEAITFKTGASSTLYNTNGYDMVWTIPSFNLSSCFQHIVFRADVHVAPYVWSPFFLQGTTRLLTSRRKYLPVNRSTPNAKIVAAFEPNLNIVKSSVIPMVIVEAFHRRYPELLEKAIITNTAKLVKNSEEFVHFAASLDITKDKKIWFESRYKFGWFSSAHIDVVLSHHWANGLNFLYLDALHQRYPLVHNSEYFKDCGYYYPESDLEAAVSALYRAIVEHDDNLEAYAAAADACIYRYSVHNPANLAGFERLISKVMAQPSKFPSNETV